MYLSTSTDDFPRNVLEYIPSTLQIVLKLSTDVLKYKVLLPGSASDPVAGRVRGMVVGQGSYKQKTLSVT